MQKLKKSIINNKNWKENYNYTLHPYQIRMDNFVIYFYFLFLSIAYFHQRRVKIKGEKSELDVSFLLN